ncbi:hypothetical protein TWF102_012001 [Orbilia oligospora]|uniref:ATP-dependent DNA helicase PIF1 n=1 Tax=Orbilia oligospora TaxID=2813651 RepID=A0A7C8N2R4_ORBOL|nr:hypothetical protein TWF102_012001 [Orbilia oligospora]KAF3100244.1 hypothetical protein TWF103_012019 [Orbilia oligospora]KAF3145792.1 hypothetical protein TWF594_011864 [Orbilia oligospora]
MWRGLRLGRVRVVAGLQSQFPFRSASLPKHQNNITTSTTSTTRSTTTTLLSSPSPSSLSHPPTLPTFKLLPSTSFLLQPSTPSALPFQGFFFSSSDYLLPVMFNRNNNSGNNSRSGGSILNNNGSSLGGNSSSNAPKQSTLSFSNKPIQKPGLASRPGLVNRPGPGKLLSASNVNSLSSRAPPAPPVVRPQFQPEKLANAPLKSTTQRSSLGKRPAGSQEALRQALQSENSFAEEPSTKFNDDRAPQTAKDALKNAVNCWDEDEFEFDDMDLLEAGLVSAKPSTTPAHVSNPTNTPLPNHMSRDTTSRPKSPPSNSPNPWKQQVEAKQDLKPVQKPAEPAPKKRRTLPWKTKQQEAELASILPPEPPKPVETPQPTKTAPWDKTASAVKAAKIDLKGKLQQQKRAISTSSLGGQQTTTLRGTKPTRHYMSDEQSHVLDMVVNEGKSVFFTGSAGTGKSVLLREIITGLRKKHKNYDSVAITASTGLAACNIGGVTLHSFSGIGLGRESVEQLVKKIRRVPKSKQRWLRAKVLIIDEISMVDGDLFDKLEGVARTLKNNGRPFGGIQLVVTGDFFQLPPVPDNGKAAKFAFEANTWSNCVDHTILLTHIFRQKDPVFAGMLNEMRLGTLSPVSIANFKKLTRNLNFDDGLQATELFPTRKEVDNANLRQLQRLPGDSYTFTAVDESAILDQQQREKLLTNCMAPQILELKQGAQVMLVKNMDETLVNGSLGRVVAFMSEKTYAMVQDELPGGEDQIFGSQGEGDLRDMSKREREIHEKYINEQSRTNTTKKYPLVQWSIADGTQRRTLMLPEAWKFELPTGEVQASRKQVPLILAWALSIHKAQGQTLDRVKVDLNKVFEKGQAYVALSRATTQEGLQVLGFNANKVMAHEKVRVFYRSLTSAEAAVRAAAAPSLNEDDFPDDEDLAEIGLAAGSSKLKKYAYS